MNRLTRITAVLTLAFAIGLVASQNASADNDDGIEASCIEDDDHDRAFAATSERGLPLPDGSKDAAGQCRSGVEYFNPMKQRFFAEDDNS